MRPASGRSKLSPSGYNLLRLNLSLDSKKHKGGTRYLMHFILGKFFIYEKMLVWRWTKGFSFLCWIPRWTVSISVMKTCVTHWMTLRKQLCFTASVFSSAKYHWQEVFHLPHRNAFIKHFGKYESFFKSKQMLLLLVSLKEAFLCWRETLAYWLYNSIIENLRQNIYGTIIPSKSF